MTTNYFACEPVDSRETGSGDFRVARPEESLRPSDRVSKEPRPDKLIYVIFSILVLFAIISLIQLAAIRLSELELEDTKKTICFPSNVTGVFFQTEQNTAIVIYDLRDDYQSKMVAEASRYFRLIRLR